MKNEKSIKKREKKRQISGGSSGMMIKNIRIKSIKIMMMVRKSQINIIIMMLMLSHKNVQEDKMNDTGIDAQDEKNQEQEKGNFMNTTRKPSPEAKSKQVGLSCDSVQAKIIRLQRQIESDLMVIHLKFTEFLSQEKINKFQT